MLPRALRCLALLAAISCNGGGAAPRTPVAAAQTAPAAEAFHPQAHRDHASALIFLAGSQIQQLVKYDVVDGFAVLEGDIILGKAAEVPIRYALPWAPVTNVKSAVAVANKSHLWPRGEIPYAFDAMSPKTRANVAWAIDHVNQTPLNMRPVVLGDRDFVVFRQLGGCSSYVGRIGGAQEILVEDGCGGASVVHEILHAAGFYHEQSRGDRDAYVTIAYHEIQRGFEDNFDKRDGRGQDVGPYDYASVMHYGSNAFSRTGRPTIMPRVNVPIGQRQGLSDGDRAAINFLYGTGEPVAPPPPILPPVNPPVISPPPTQAGASFAGNYTSSRGNVACSQTGSTVSCTYPAGSMVCTAMGTRLDCGWLGGGSGRATFDRQPDGRLIGTHGDFFSPTSRGSWDLVPTNGPPPTQPQPPPVAPPPPTAPPVTAPSGVAGNYSTTRGPMACTESASVVTCGFQQNGANGRLDCLKDVTGLELQCTWATLLPNPGSGRATFARPSTATRNFSGTWGYFFDGTNGGNWTLTGM